MFFHYVKTAFRNLKKYRTQSLISIAGLSVGFVCFTLSMIWIRYETTYDSFHKDASLIYRVRQKTTLDANGLFPYTPYSLPGYLKNTFPDIQAACAIQLWPRRMTMGGNMTDVTLLTADSSFFDTFSATVLSGNKNMLRLGSKGYVITENAARKWFGKENPVGKEITLRGDSPKMIEAIGSPWSTHSNIFFDIIETPARYPDSEIPAYQTYIRIRKGTDAKALFNKLSQHTSSIPYLEMNQLEFTPVTSIHYQNPDHEKNVKFGHVVLFAVSGGLVMLCALLNFLMLFINRIRIRGKELALRKVNGASNRSFFYLLGMELLLILVGSILVGIILTEFIQPRFIELAQMQNREDPILKDIFLYAGGVIAGVFLLSILPVQYFRRATLLSTIQGKSGSHGRNLFRKVSLLLQMVISIGLMFCSSVLFKQVRFLSNTDLGLERKNVSVVSFFANPGNSSVIPVLKQKMEKLSGIREVLDVKFSLFPQTSFSSSYIDQWEDMAADADPIETEPIYGGPELTDFYNFTFVKGRGFLPEDDPESCAIINETLCKRFGWHDPIGKKFNNGYQTVIGVIKDYYNLSPLMSARPVVIYPEENDANKCDIIYKYVDHQKENCEQQIREILLENFPEKKFAILDAEVEYAKYIQSENYLLLLLGFISAVCIVVCTFGLYSLAALTIEEKRKSIAIRKVNGATTREILKMFMSEYLLLLCINRCILFRICSHETFS